MSIRPVRILALLLLSGVMVAAPAAVATSKPALEDRADILIERDTEFDADHGVRSGTGTAADPYVISGWRVNNLHIHDTMSHVVIRDNEVTGFMILDWIGPGVTVVHNTVGDLRVNRNVTRSGQMTGGRIAHNTFGVVGQLRHWDGVFEHNRVGTPEGDGFFRGRSSQAVAFDGFNGARFRDNTIYGFVDVTLHGHHHGSGFGRPSHDHAGNAMSEGDHAGHAHAGHAKAGAVDHSKRYHELWITGNVIHSTADFALRYNDQAHSANDRTNASETDPNLEKPHVHFTRVHLAGNRLVGSGLVVSVFNADDELHTGTRRGLVEIRRNRISLDAPSLGSFFGGRDGIRIEHLADADVRAVGNSIETARPAGLAASEPFRSWDQGSGFRISFLTKSRVWVLDNRVTNRPYGVVASQFARGVHWWVRGLYTRNVSQDIVYDDSVRNPPNRG